jgi:hypothetical protein
MSNSTHLSKAESIAALLGAGKAERNWIRLLLALGKLGCLISLAWLTLRTRPMSLLRMVTQIGARRAILAAQASRRQP